MPHATSRLLLLLGLAVLLGAPAQAQRYAQYSRAADVAPSMLGRGDAGVALADASTAFFYNPAHLARLGLGRPRVTFVGARVEASTKLFSDLDFFRNDVQPALEAGIDWPPDRETRDLFERALAQGRRPTVAAAGIALPSVMMSAGPYAVGAGLFATNVTRYRFDDDGSGIPILDLFSQIDAGLVASGAAQVPGTRLAAGLTGRYARRYLAHKDKDFLAIDPNGEQLYVLRGSTVAFDLGLHYADLLPATPGRLDLGLAVYDLVGGGFDYALDGGIDFTGGGAVDDREVDYLLEAFEGRDGAASFRVGAAYHLPQLLALGPVHDLAVALDYVSTSTSESEQPFLSKLRLGTQAAVGPVALRLGLSQGYPTLGAGLDLRFVQLDYALYGIEDGRLPGQLHRYNHLVQVRFGLF